jgi:hypothetical protein
MEKEIVYIYALCDPVTMRIRYVGKSNNPNERFSSHLSERSLKVKNEKNAWIKSLLEQGMKPVMIILQEVTHGCWAEAERAWICLLRMQGCIITNSSDGGEGILDQTDYQTSPKALPKPRSRAPARAPHPGSGKGGLIPSRPGAAPFRRGDKYSPQDKNGIDREHTPKPPRKRKPRAKPLKPRKKSGS